MTYNMKRYQKTGDTYTVVGDLTLLGMTKEITLVGAFNVVAKDPWEKYTGGVSSRRDVNRKDFGMTWSKLFGYWIMEGSWSEMR